MGCQFTKCRIEGIGTQAPAEMQFGFPERNTLQELFKHEEHQESGLHPVECEWPERLLSGLTLILSLAFRFFLPGLTCWQMSHPLGASELISQVPNSFQVFQRVKVLLPVVRFYRNALIAFPDQILLSNQRPSDQTLIFSSHMEVAISGKSVNNFLVPSSFMCV